MLNYYSGRHRVVVHYLKWKKLADSLLFVMILLAPLSRNDPILLEPVQHSQGGGAVKHTLGSRL